MNYDEVTNITDSNTIPVLLVTYPEQYLNGRLLYKNQFVDMRSLLVKDANSTGVTIPKINFYIIPHILEVEKGNMGSILYDVKIDYVTDFDTYGFMSKEIDSILKLHYYRKFPGEFHSVKSTHTNLYFIPEKERFLNQESIINRIAQLFNIRFCKLI